MSKLIRNTSASASTLVAGLTLAYVLFSNVPAWWTQSLTQPIASIGASSQTLAV